MDAAHENPEPRRSPVVLMPLARRKPQTEKKSERKSPSPPSDQAESPDEPGYGHGV